jgi:hypothetical protein
MGFFGMLGKKPGTPQYDLAMAAPANGGNMGLDLSLPVDQFAGQRQEAKPGFFGKGGLGGKLLMGGIGGALDGVAVWGGAKPGYSEAMSDERDYQQELHRAELLARLKAETEARNPQAVNLGDGGFGTYSPAGGLSVLREPYHAPKEDTIITRLTAAGIDPASPQGQQMIRESLPGYGNSDEVFGRRRDLKQTVPGKAPGLGGGHGRAAPHPPAGFILD